MPFSKHDQGPHFLARKASESCLRGFLGPVYQFRIKSRLVSIQSQVTQRCRLQMSSAPHQGAPSGADIPSSSLQTRPMLSPIRTQPSLQSYSAHPASQPSQRAPSTYPDDPSTQPWSSTPHFAPHSHQAQPPSMHGSLLDNNTGYASSSHHQNQQHQSYVVNSNVYLDSPTRSLSPPDSANPYSSSMSPIASTFSMQQQLPASGKAPKASGRAARGQGKAPTSGVRGAAGSSASASASAAAAAARTAQPKSNRKQFSACGACQLRQSVSSFSTPLILS